MAFKIFLHPKAKNSLDKLDSEIRKRIKNKISELKEFPERGKHLKYSTFRSLRVGDYRTIYEVDKKEQKIIILFIGHRKNVYSDFSRLF